MMRRRLVRRRLWAYEQRHALLGEASQEVRVQSPPHAPLAMSTRHCKFDYRERAVLSLSDDVSVDCVEHPVPPRVVVTS